jgi:hypothetical protein
MLKLLYLIIDAQLYLIIDAQLYLIIDAHTTPVPNLL